MFLTCLNKLESHSKEFFHRFIHLNKPEKEREEIFIL